MDRVSRECKFMPNVRQESERSVFVYSPDGAIGRAALCWLERWSPKNLRLVPSNRYDLFQPAVDYLIFWTAWLNVSSWVSPWVSPTR